MDFIVDYTPAPSEHEWVQGDAAAARQWRAPKRHETDTEPVSLYVFKTVSIRSPDEFPISRFFPAY